MDVSSDKLNILFLCTGNSCRSQMAEGWARNLWGNKMNFYSAGIEKHGLDPATVKVMAEAGIDISGHRSKTIEELGDLQFDFVITLCDHARETCPLFSGNARMLHEGFADPAFLARNTTDEQEKLGEYRRVRDEIRAFVTTLPDALPGSGGPDTLTPGSDNG